MGNFKEDIARTEAFIFDVDGVMTDGGIIPTLDGDFIRRYNAKDGYALGYAVKMGYKVCIITGGRGKTLENRLRMLGINRYYTDCMDKITAMREYFADEGIDPAHAIYMGDDIPDLECMREVGIPVCPADAAAEVLIDGLAVFLQDERIGAVFKQRGQILQLHSGRIPLGSCFSFWIMTSDSSSAITITPTAIR